MISTLINDITNQETIEITKRSFCLKDKLIVDNKFIVLLTLRVFSKTTNFCLFTSHLSFCLHREFLTKRLIWFDILNVSLHICLYCKRTRHQHIHYYHWIYERIIPSFFPIRILHQNFSPVDRRNFSSSRIFPHRKFFLQRKIFPSSEFFDTAHQHFTLHRNFI